MRSIGPASGFIDRPSITAMRNAHIFNGATMNLRDIFSDENKDVILNGHGRAISSQQVRVRAAVRCWALPADAPRFH
jgi:hypothetical protein